MFKKNYKKIFLSLLLLAGIFFLTRGAGAQLGLNEINNGLNGSLTATDPRILAGRIVNIGLGFLGVIAVGLIIYAGFIWMTANGEEEKISTAQKILKNAVIGLVIILMSWAIANFVLGKFGGAINPPHDICTDLDTRVCGCGGTETCLANTWGSCIGSDCSGCTTPPCGPASCDGSTILPGCQATADICAPSNYCDPGDCGCKPRGNLGDPCSSASDTCQADNNRCAEFLTCNPATCTCFGPPIITEISPVGGFCENDVNRSCREDTDCSSATCNLTAANGAHNNFLTILGKNFGVYSATSSRVVFEGNSNPRDGVSPHDLNIACINTWHDDQIVIAVPAGASNGPIKVVNRDGLSDNTASSTPGPVLPDFQANNIVRPGLCYLNPASGTLNSQIGYGGINLFSGTAYFGNYKNNVRALDSQFGSPAGLVGTSTTPNIRSGVSGSFVRNILSGQPENSNFLRFTKYPEPAEGPFISSFAPVNGTAGQYVTIRGSGFGGARGGNHVYFSTDATSTEASYNFPEVCLNSVWKNNQIVVKVPAGLANGAQTIEITLGTTTIDTQKLNPPAFNFNINSELNPSLCKIEPERGPVGTPVSLWGEYFGTGEGLVRFNSNKDATGTIGLDGRASKIPTAVPVGAITGPVKVIHNSVGGNEMNFAVGECTTDAECGTQVCCPASTYKKGRCANTLAACFIDIPNSVFEWSFSTGFGTTTVNPDAYSCAGLAQYYGSCQTGSSCPNVPGTCSPYPGGGKQAVGSCDYSCDTVPGCNALSPCSYNISLNRCVKNNATCDLPQTFASTTPATTETCNADGHWEITIRTSCPDGWTRGANNRCVNLNSSCSVCSANLACQKIQSTDTVGSCVSPAVCPSGSTCEDSSTGPDRCVITTQPTCDCCCQIGQDARDCCAPLRCEGSCGADTGNPNPTLGKCGGCKSAGDTTEARDAACNCSGHNGQFCDINNTAFPDGVCTDCSGIKPSDCSDHSSVCCRDSRKTLAPADDICRGGDGRIISNSTSSLEYGYCAYYNCSNIVDTAPQCASTTPVVIGAYPSVAACVGGCQQADPCPALTTLSACQANSRCCFDAKKTQVTTDDVCRLGTAISGGADDGYCGYYDCADQTADNAAMFRSRSFNSFNSFSASTSTPPQVCASTTPVKIGTYNNIAACEYGCANPPAGAGLSCAGSTSTSTCATSLCTYPSMGCFDKDGNLRGTPEDCGTCCCQPGSIDPLTNFKCVADQGACTGASRGLFCGCKSDTECGAPTTTGCGASTCCQARPEITSTLPAHLADKVCRNAVVKVNFNQLMDAGTFNNNVLLLEERDYGNGVCPTGSFVAGNSLSDIIAPPHKNWLTRLVENIQTKLARLAGRVAEEAQATLPDPSKLYCAVAGTVSGESNAGNGSLIFAPEKILSPAANYYLIVKGDENLNSQTGVLSAAEIGFNGRGYFDESTNTYVPGKVVLFNNRGYKNSQIFKFTTLSAQGPSAGICAVDHTSVTPVSHLFKTTSNALASEENDTDPNSPLFDTANDKDKVFTATAYSVDKQILQPVVGYLWDWDFRIDNPAVAVSTAVSGLAVNKLFVTAVSGVTDGETTVTATINMNRFRPPLCGSNCNAYSGGDGFNSLANLYVFICSNPWPPVGASGNWSPWADTNVNCLPSSGNCADYNYKFYYCRDAGAVGTLDDLPAILNPPVIRGQSSNLLCSADRSPCSAFNAACGPDNNGDGSPDGICIWDILKESYFFREVILPGGQSLLATDARTGGKINLTWSSAAAQVGAYKIYYLKSGNGTMQSQEVKALPPVCTTSAGFNNCAASVSGLTNNVPYVFKISVISVNRTESQLSAEVTAKPTDQTPPAVPVGLKTTVSTTTVLFAWRANTDDAIKYRLYHGVRSGAYGESFDSAPRITTLSFPRGQFSTTTLNYFAVSALDASGNESAKSGEINDSNWAQQFNNN